jgi:hypothetical protein
MSTVAIVKHIADQLASARCLQDLDNELSKIPQHDWQVFVESMRSEMEVVEENDPQRAKSLRSLLHSYLERRQVVRAAGYFGDNH